VFARFLELLPVTPTIVGHVARVLAAHFGGSSADDELLSATELAFVTVLRQALPKAKCFCAGAWRASVELLGRVPYARLKTQRSDCACGKRLTFLREIPTTVFTLKGGSLPAISEAWECKKCRIHYLHNSKKVFRPKKLRRGEATDGSVARRISRPTVGEKRSLDQLRNGSRSPVEASA